MVADDAGETTGREWDFVRVGGVLPGAVASAVGYASGDSVQPVHRGLPSPYLTFIITLNTPVVEGSTADEALGPGASRLDVVTAGLHTAPSYIAQSPGQAGVQLAVYPLAARRILGMPAGELAERSHDGTDVLGRAIGELRDRMIEAPDWDSRFLALRGFLGDRMRLTERAPAARPEAAEAWRWLARHRGAGSVGGLADHVGLSRRQVQTVFVREFGVGPKAFNRLLRFQRAVRAITEQVGEGESPDLASIAAECGFYDQPHLNRDFRMFTGTAPASWIAEEAGSIRAGGHRNGDEPV
ncbi:AraC family transcriptional regulator [Streptomonospora sp. PA3]|uniref:AraC family transcriptional regulator n=1 Tax=Streptomonospora sp. PA3 TaxID=2607326 RepID=UPI0012DF5645|nr:helix-turn-helix domain-containing protein [Streptomonospora sp. PA3]MUL43733.1 AraC family transcriptional regulator [Streptomonospora sp. PA3]